MLRNILLKILNQYKGTRWFLKKAHEQLEVMTLISLKNLPGIIAIYNLRPSYALKEFGRSDLDLALVWDVTQVKDEMTFMKDFNSRLKLIKFFLRVVDEKGVVLIPRNLFLAVHEYGGTYLSELYPPEKWQLMIGQELRPSTHPKTSYSPDFVWMAQALLKNQYLTLRHKKKHLEKISLILNVEASQIDTPYSLYMRLELFAQKHCRLEKIFKIPTFIPALPGQITNDSYQILPTGLKQIDFLRELDLSKAKNGQGHRVHIFGEYFFSFFLNHYLHYVAYEPALLREHLCLGQDYAKLSNAIYRDTLMEKIERLSKDMRYRHSVDFRQKVKKLRSYQRILNHDQNLSFLGSFTSESPVTIERVNDEINHCLKLLGQEAHALV